MTRPLGDREEGTAPLPDGGSIAYEVSGLAHGGPPILLVRPLGGTMALWGAFRVALTASHRVISFDHRGSGGSSAAPPVVTTAQLARDALALLDHLDVDRAHVFGISLGGMAATWLQVAAPGRTARLCLASTPAKGRDATNAGIRRELALARAFLRRPGDVEARLVHRTLSTRFRREQPDEVERIEHLVGLHPSSPAALLKHVAAAALHDARSLLPRIEAPTLVLAGEEDELLGVQPVRDLAAAMPKASFETIPAAGHALTLEQPVETAARLTRFLGGDDRSGGR